MQMELSDFTAVIGIDWADKKHDVCVQAMGSDKLQFSIIPHQVNKIDEWAQSMYMRHGGQMAVALELAKGPIVSALQKYNFFVIYPINPTTLAKYRQAFNPSGAKDDPTDAELALDLLLKHPGHFEALNPQSVEMRTLMTLVEQRRRLMNERVRITNRLRNALKQYYPQALDWFGRIDTPLFGAFIRQWPSLSQAKRARRATLAKFFHKHKLYRRSAGSTGVGNVLRSCVKPSSSGLRKPSTNLIGRACTTTSSEPKGVPTKPPYARSRLNGSAYSIVAG